MSDESLVDGVLMAGEGDAFYFIPAEDLERYRVATVHAPTARELMGSGSDVHGFMLACNEAQGFFGFKVGVPSELLPAIRPVATPAAQAGR